MPIVTKDFDAGELKLVPFSPRLDVSDDNGDAAPHGGVIVECMDALPDLKKNIIAVNPPEKKKLQSLLPVRIPYWYVKALPSADSVNLSTKKETVTIPIWRYQGSVQSAGHEQQTCTQKWGRNQIHA